MDKDSITSFGDAFKKFLSEENLETRFHEKQIVSEWEQIIGKPIADRTTNIYVRQKILYVTLNSAPLKQELQNTREKIRGMINDRIGKEVVKEVRFQ